MHRISKTVFFARPSAVASVTCIPHSNSPGEDLIDLYMGMADEHEVELNATDDPTCNQRTQVRQDDVVLVIADTIIQLYVQLVDVSLLIAAAV